ncbi:DUF2062 domain-containing protein [Pseudooceanicola nitratireducens]|uniref:DUF2062 domain-containing protein n=1 Tax=Pseudooceanicola nitratireducens TaxID=517719 RepID=UPI001C945584|nr:DUF2062 domain-containing protein [Pseudooceanicola nitratireducens]MBY6164388.1 DUF2062 domain-containing protein [Pseudooceanicola nitratireducens]
MVFKRRDRRPLWKMVAEFFWPRGGWGRAALYVKHRMRRLPDTPEKIARGIFAGIFTVFSPFYGMHFVVAALIAFIVRGNVLAALLATFVGNPLTYVPIALVSIQTGLFLMGRHPGAAGSEETYAQKFFFAAEDLKNNVIALFTDVDADWTALKVFYHDIFYPYMIGGIVPGIIFALVAYYLSVPLIRAYQARRRGALKKKLAALRAKAEANKHDTGKQAADLADQDHGKGSQ